MSYRDTARAYVQAERYTTPTSGTPSPGAMHHAAKLPMSEWAESRRDLMSPQTIARNHAEHVEERAAELREALERYKKDREFGGGIVLGALVVADAAQALLNAIGEGER